MPNQSKPRMVVDRARRGVGAFLVLVALSVIIMGCSRDEPAYVERSVEEIYNQAMDKLLAGDSVEDIILIVCCCDW